jgi:hypothetical protein
MNDPASAGTRDTCRKRNHYRVPASRLRTARFRQIACDLQIPVTPARENAR